jgi:TolA-binding protein
MRRTSLARVAALAAASTLTACWVPIERGRQMEARLQRLEVQGVESQRTLDDRVARADEKIREVQAKIDELNKAARRSGADLGVQLGRLAEELARVKGELEVARHDVDVLQKSVAAADEKTDARFAALKGAGALDAFEAKQKLADLPKGDEKGGLFALAKKQDHDGNAGVARELYEEYARRYASDPRSAEALFRAGELSFDQKRWREALLSYGKVAEDFPRAELAPDAMLGAAEAMVRLEMRDEARAVLGQLLERYPKAKVAAKAKERLDELSPPPAPAPEPAPKPKPKAAPAPRKPAPRK